MIKINTYFQKEKLNKKNKEDLLLVELSGVKQNTEKSKKRKLNLSLSIDISGSMSMIVNNKELGNFFNPFLNLNNLENKESNNIQETKIEQAKKLAIKAIENMDEGDIISVTTFNEKGNVFIPSTIITKENRNELYNKIKTLSANGMTNLHEGWLKSVTEVAKELKEDYLNRVIVLTDGEITSGIRDIDTISKDVMNLNNKYISTTTLGIGQDFNEELLESMANNGGGNFYYISNSEDFDKTFEEEFTGLNTIAATDIRLSLNLKSDFTVIQDFNELSKINDSYIIRNLSNNNKISILFKIGTNISKDKEIVNVGEITIDYKDSAGKNCQDVVFLRPEVTSGKEWKKLPDNKEVKVQEVLLSVALNKKKSREALKTGDVTLAKTFLQNSADIVGASSYSDARLKAESQSLNASILDADNSDVKEFSKALFYQSYNTRTGKV